MKMSKETNKPQIIIDDKEYNFDDMTDQQKILVNHVADLDRKIGSTQFNLDQLMVGKQAFVTMLKQELEKIVQPDTGVQDVQIKES
jgi:hypothetical protein